MIIRLEKYPQIVLHCILFMNLDLNWHENLLILFVQKNMLIVLENNYLTYQYFNVS